MDKNILFILKSINNYKFAINFIENFKMKSNRGYLYELLWDICIKFGLVKELTNIKTEHYFDNINKSNIISKNIKDYFDNYLKENYISSKKTGYSDINFKTDNIEYRISVKFFEKEKSIDKYDIQKLCPLISDKDKNYKILLFINNKKKFIDKINKANKSSNILIKYISYNNYENVYGLNDLEKYYIKLKDLLELYNNFKDDKDIQEFKKYLGIQKDLFNPRFHQDLFIEKISELLLKNNKHILIGAVPRSGKTFIMAGTILNFVINNPNKKHNFIIITPAPTETIEQYKEVFEKYLDFENNNIKVISIQDKYNKNSYNNKFNNVYLVSKQKLGYNKDNLFADNINKLKLNIIFDIIFMDEAHFGMTTYQTKTIIKTLNPKQISPVIYVTATYNKPIYNYEIPKENIITWDINNISLFKNLYKFNQDEKIIIKWNEIISILEKNFGNNIIHKVLTKYNYNKENLLYVIKLITNQYKHFPSPFLLTTIWEDFNKIYNEEDKANGLNITFDMLKLFTINKNGKFENEEQVEELLFYYFGYPNKNTDYKSQLFYKERGMMPRIQRICNNNCRTLQSPYHNTSQLWFLPFGQGRPIEPIIIALLELLSSKFKKIFEDNVFLICIDEFKNVKKIFSDKFHNIKYSDNNDIKYDIKIAEKYVNENGKKNLIILTAGKLQLGISLNNVDIVVLFNNLSSSDSIYQMMFRSMTEIDDNLECDDDNYCGKKKYGFIVDLNPQRTILLANYIINQLSPSSIKTNDPEYNFKLIANLLNIDRDIFGEKYNNDKDIEKFTKELFNRMNNFHDVKTSNILNIINDIEFDKIDFKDLIIKYNLSNNFERIIFKEGIDKKTKNLIKEKIKSKSNSKSTENYIDDYEKIKKYLYAEIISISIILSTQNNIDEQLNNCIFKENKQKDYIKINSDLIKIIQEIEKDDILKELFVDTFNNRINFKEKLQTEQVFDLVKTILISIKKENNIETIMIKPNNKCKDDEIFNPKTKRCVKKTGKIGKNLFDKLKGGNNFAISNYIYSVKRKLYNINEPDKLLEFIHDNLAPKEIEKKERGEVFTPMNLINEMLDKLPEEVWINPDLKWLDPACGMGNFPVAIYLRLMKSLKFSKKFRYAKDEEIRSHILEKMIYIVEIDKKNVYLIKRILCGNKYKLNIFEGSFIKETNNKFVDILFGNKQANKKENLEFEKNLKSFNNNFDIILGNPPYNKPNSIGTGNTIYPFFIKLSLNLLIKNGLLLFITPPTYRKPLQKSKNFSPYKDLFNLMTKKNQMIYLKIYNSKDSLNIFNVSIRFDIYLIEKQPLYKKTIIIGVDKKEYNINLKKWDFLPNGEFNFVNKLINNKIKCDILYSRSLYSTTNENTNNIKNTKYIYPLIDSINKNGIKYYYSNNNTGFFGIPKIIFGSSGINNPIIDIKGEYGMTQHAFAIKINSIKEGNEIKKAIISNRFLYLIKEIFNWSTFLIDWNLFTYFNKDFYKEFI